MTTLVKWAVLGALALMLALLSTSIQASPAGAQEQYPVDSGDLRDFEAQCFTDGQFDATDGCVRSAETLGIELDNIRESEAKGCSLEDMFEDYSCKGPGAPSPSVSGQPTVATSQGEIEQAYKAHEAIANKALDLSEDGHCVTVILAEDVDPAIVDGLKAQGFWSMPDGAEQVKSPKCAEGEFLGAFPDVTQEQILNNPCLDVVGSSLEDARVEYIGCPPVTQKGTLAPKDWKERVTPVKPASKSSKATQSESSKVAANLEAAKLVVAVMEVQKAALDKK